MSQRQPRDGVISFIISYTVHGKSKIIFSDAEVATIRAMFSDIILGKPISKAEIKKRCSETEEGKALLHKLSVVQLMNRIKYERKKKRSEKQ